MLVLASIANLVSAGAKPEQRKPRSSKWIFYTLTRRSHFVRSYFTKGCGQKAARMASTRDRYQLPRNCCDPATIVAVKQPLRGDFVVRIYFARASAA
jgi:hypothetical protein